jgi:DNA/RNA-binding domain of Phe-tRNA-synthetase-like protein
VLFLKKIVIDPEIHSLTPSFAIGVLLMNVTVGKSEELDQKLSMVEKSLRSQYTIKDVIHLDVISQGRDAYRAYGRDPSRYRLAVESLFRRIVKGNDLYRINNVVDVGNLLSILTHDNVAVLDYDNIQGDIKIRLGREDDEYYGIGRGRFNVTKIPLYEDEIGPFGSTTSDTERTMIRPDTKNVLLFIISFIGKKPLEEHLETAKELYETYCQAKVLEMQII